MLQARKSSVRIGHDSELDTELSGGCTVHHQFMKPDKATDLNDSRWQGIEPFSTVAMSNSTERDDKSDRAPNFIPRPPRLTAEWIESQGMVAHPARSLQENTGLMTKPPCIRLSIEDLKSFEAVERQFCPWGVELSNAIALRPSNDAYPPRSGKMVLLGGPKSGWMEIAFERPVSFFNCYVTSSQRVVLLAYDRDGQTLTQTEMSEPNLANSESKIAPNAQLSAIATQIARVTLYAFDGQITVDDLSFGF